MWQKNSDLFLATIYSPIVTMAKSSKATTRKIIVCSACGKADCWNGINYCANYRTAGTVELSVPLPETDRERIVFNHMQKYL